MVSSKDMTWPTPESWFRDLDREFGFTLDPCCLPETAKCARYFTPVEDGLAQSWAGERVFMNPPYGRHLPKWMRKAFHEARDRGALVVCFVPARVDTRWWHDWAVKGDVRFPKGRVKGQNGADWPFPVAIVVFRPGVGRSVGRRKRHLVEAALADPEMRNWSQGRIAAHCGVTQAYVSRLDNRSSHNSYDLKTLGLDGRRRKHRCFGYRAEVQAATA
jgi:site-specific DNA-methyltransferase (adenine-specific)